MIKGLFGAVLAVVMSVAGAEAGTQRTSSGTHVMESSQVVVKKAKKAKKDKKNKKSKTAKKDKKSKKTVAKGKSKKKKDRTLASEGKKKKAKVEKKKAKKKTAPAPEPAKAEAPVEPAHAAPEAIDSGAPAMDPEGAMDTGMGDLPTQ